jgi:AraC-like DNA-binding protein
MARREGFAGQRMQVLPRPRVSEALHQPITRRLLVTDCGYFPSAVDHFRQRARGAPAAIIILCTQGAGFVDLGVRRMVGPGQVVAIPPEQPHSYGADPRQPWTIWWMHVVGDDVPDLLAAATQEATDPVIRVRDPARLASLIEDALSHLERADTDLELIAAAGAAWHALATLCSDRHVGSRDDPIRDPLRRLHSHEGRRLSVAELAARVSLSPTHFAVLFRKATGLSVLQYQTRLAMNRARVLLDDTDMAVASIAAKVGYPDPFYFSRRFRAVHGMNPSQYRQGAKG